MKMLTPVNAIQKDMEQMAKSISTINNISNDNSWMQNVTNEFHISLPNITDSTRAEYYLEIYSLLEQRKCNFLIKITI